MAPMPDDPRDTDGDCHVPSDLPAAAPRVPMGWASAGDDVTIASDGVFVDADGNVTTRAKGPGAQVSAGTEIATPAE